MEYDVYFDESGDLGWTLDQPFRKGGSSQFFTIAYLILPNEKNKHINRFVKKLYKERGSEKEKKGARFKKGKAKSLSARIIGLLDIHKDITIGSVTVKKSSVPLPLINSQNDNVIYNHMVQKAICDKIASLGSVNIIPDKRSVPAASQNSCPDLIKNDLWLWKNSVTQIHYQPEESHNNERLMFIDWVANFVWRHYEDQHSGAYNILGKHLLEDKLFFE